MSVRDGRLCRSLGSVPLIVGAIAHSSLERRFPPLIVGGVVEFEETESGLVLVGLVGGAVLGGVLLGLPRVCSS